MATDADVAEEQVRVFEAFADPKPWEKYHVPVEDVCEPSWCNRIYYTMVATLDHVLDFELETSFISGDGAESALRLRWKHSVVAMIADSSSPAQIVKQKFGRAIPEKHTSAAW